MMESAEERRARFWSRDAAWPADTVGWLFLGRALDQLGPALVDEWTGQEFSSARLPTIPAAPPDVDHNPETRAVARLALDWFQARFPALEIETFSVLDEGAWVEVPRFNETQWLVVLEIAADRQADQRARDRRALALYDQVRTAGQAAKLTFGSRSREGGDPIATLAPSTWNIDDYPMWWAMAECLIRGRWLYVERNSLNALLTGQEAPLRHQADSKDEEDDASSSKEDAVRLVYAELFAGGAPEGMTVSKRNSVIRAKIGDLVTGSVSDRTIRRALQNA